MTSKAWGVIADRTNVGTGTSVLDLGCGTGGFCALAADRGATVRGVDALPDRIAAARRRVPAGDFRVGRMEALPWAAGSFDVVTGFNSFQYASDVEQALREACRVARPDGCVVACKYGRPVDNQFLVFLSTLGPEPVELERLAHADPLDRALERLGIDVRDVGDAPASMAFANDQALAAALTSAGGPSGPKVLAAAEPYRQPDGSYRFENRLTYRILAP